MFVGKGRVGSEGKWTERETSPLFSPSKGNGDLFRMTSCVSDPKVNADGKTGHKPEGES